MVQRQRAECWRNRKSARRGQIEVHATARGPDLDGLAVACGRAGERRHRLAIDLQVTLAPGAGEARAAALDPKATAGERKLYGPRAGDVADEDVGECQRQA